MDHATNNRNAPFQAAFANAITEGAALPTEIQYMPPGRHRIRASQGGKPVSVEVAVNASPSAVLQTFLACKLSAAARAGPFSISTTRPAKPPHGLGPSRASGRGTG